MLKNTTKIPLLQYFDTFGDVSVLTEIHFLLKSQSMKYLIILVIILAMFTVTWHSCDTRFQNGREEGPELDAR